jgi:hypothetical protein
MFPGTVDSTVIISHVVTQVFLGIDSIIAHKWQILSPAFSYVECRATTPSSQKALVADMSIVNRSYYHK